MTKYLKIADILKAEITSGKYTSGKLPSQSQLAIQHKTTRTTIDKALKILQKEHLIDTFNGKGSYVRTHHTHLKANQHLGLYKKYGNTYAISAKIISFIKRFPDFDEATFLKVSQNDLVYDIIRVRYLDNKPLEIEYTIMPVKVIPGLTEEILSKSIYQYIEHELGLTIANFSRRIHADKADTFDVKHLLIDESDPILEIEQIVMLSDGQPFEFSQTRYPYQTGEFFYNSYD
ncbi:GntR family transcriptional regulator [Streptococcus pluranimalium]|uniref:GntR family transcriptional regulator n=1 Tax=Streptococcus pluranimalium TaxID=82348 RepID=A0A2L0D349_9STRE|nr:GntR family transcriptional regulator [Streptococcus pluranimalium]AUW96257.1 GntR family transcriptional regulator [Streptococcus pluranimalium]